MNGSKSYGPSGEERTSGEVPTRFAELTSAFPSPRPSPLGRGRIVRCLSGKPSAVSARQTSGAIRPGAECSLSPWERVRVRGIVVSLDTPARTIPERSHLVRAGGFAHL